jgi:hypothetical protein
MLSTFHGWPPQRRPTSLPAGDRGWCHTAAVNGEVRRCMQQAGWALCLLGGSAPPRGAAQHTSGSDRWCPRWRPKSTHMGRRRACVGGEPLTHGGAASAGRCRGCGAAAAACTCRQQQQPVLDLPASATSPLPVHRQNCPRIYTLLARLLWRGESQLFLVSALSRVY